MVTRPVLIYTALLGVLGGMLIGMLISESLKGSSVDRHALRGPINSFESPYNLVQHASHWPRDKPFWLVAFPRPEWSGPDRRTLTVLNDGKPVARWELLPRGTVPSTISGWRPPRYSAMVPPQPKKLAFVVTNAAGDQIVMELVSLSIDYTIDDTLMPLPLSDPKHAIIEEKIDVSFSPVVKDALLLTIPDELPCKDVAIGCRLDVYLEDRLVGTAEVWRHEYLGDPQSNPIRVNWKEDVPRSGEFRIRIQGDLELSRREMCGARAYWAGNVERRIVR